MEIIVRSKTAKNSVALRSYVDQCTVYSFKTVPEPAVVEKKRVPLVTLPVPTTNSAAPTPASGADGDSSFVLFSYRVTTDQLNIAVYFWYLVCQIITQIKSPPPPPPQQKNQQKKNK